MPWLEAPPALLMLAPLAVAAGVDLYLTLLLLGFASHSGWWPSVPGAVGDLSAVGILVTVGGFYVLEVAAERWPSTALIWNAFHAIIRPLAGALLALLLLEGLPFTWIVPSALLAGLIASLTHATRTGAAVLLWLDSAEHPRRGLVSVLEDVTVAGFVVLLLDHPTWALAIALLLFVLALRFVGSQVRAFLFAVRLVWSRAWTTLGQPRWLEPEAFPRWVRRSLAGDVMAPGGGLRGSPAGAHRLPGSPLFVTGWVVVRGDTPLFVFRRLRRSTAVELGATEVLSVTEQAFFRRVALRAGGPSSLYFGLAGPSRESLRAEFMSGTRHRLRTTAREPGGPTGTASDLPG